MTDTAELIARLRAKRTRVFGAALSPAGAGRTNALIADRNSARSALGGKAALSNTSEGGERNGD